jgi:hypothetical protein
VLCKIFIKKKRNYLIIEWKNKKNPNRFYFLVNNGHWLMKLTNFVGQSASLFLKMAKWQFVKKPVLNFCQNLHRFYEKKIVYYFSSTYLCGKLAQQNIISLTNIISYVGETR